MSVITYKHNSLIARCKHICNSEHISLTRYIFDGPYANQCKKKMNTISTDGLSESIKGLLFNYTSQSKHLINLLLKPFKSINLQFYSLLYFIILAIFLNIYTS